MEETKIETLNEETSDVVEEVEEIKEAPKRRGRKPKVESAEEAKSEEAKSEEAKSEEAKSLESVDTPYEETVDEVQSVTNETESTDDAISENSKPEESEVAKDEPSHETVVEDTSEDSKFSEEPREFPISIRLSKPIMFYAAPTKHRASGLIRGTLIVKEELHNFIKVSIVIPEFGRTTGYVLRSELLSRM